MATIPREPSRTDWVSAGVEQPARESPADAKKRQVRQLYMLLRLSSFFVTPLIQYTINFEVGPPTGSPRRAPSNLHHRANGIFRSSNRCLGLLLAEDLRDGLA